MSLTSHIKNKTDFYYAMLGILDIQHCHDILQEQNRLMGRPSVVPEDFDAIDFPIQGTAVIYAAREYLLTVSFWQQTLLGRAGMSVPVTPPPDRWFDMAYMEAGYRVSSKGREHIPLNDIMRADLLNIIHTFPLVLGKPSQYLDVPCHMNPNFTYGNVVGGADANMIIGDTLWDIKTTLKRSPFTLDDIIQQVAYVLLDGEMDYHIRQITWYYTRQLKTFTYPASAFLKPKYFEDFETIGDLLWEDESFHFL